MVLYGFSNFSLYLGGTSNIKWVCGVGSNDSYNGWWREDATNPLSSAQEWVIPDSSSWVSTPGRFLFSIIVKLYFYYFIYFSNMEYGGSNETK